MWFLDFSLQKTYLYQISRWKDNRFYPWTPILVKFSNLNNFGTTRSWELKFSGIDNFSITYKYWKNEQNLRGKGINIQKYWMIQHGTTLWCVFVLFIYTISISIISVYKHLTNRCVFSKWIIFEKKRHWRK